MTAEQTAINSRALMAAAAKVERLCPQVEDPYRWVEGMVLSTLADGYRQIERIPDLRPANVATDAQRAKHLADARNAIRRNNDRQETGQ